HRNRAGSEPRREDEVRTRAQEASAKTSALRVAVQSGRWARSTWEWSEIAVDAGAGNSRSAGGQLERAGMSALPTSPHGQFAYGPSAFFTVSFGSGREAE